MLQKSIIATKIKYQALAALFLPIVLPIICFSMLFQLMSQIEAMSIQEEQLSTFNSRAEREMILGVSAIGDYMTYAITGDQLQAEHGHKNLELARMNLEDMAKAAGDDPRLIKELTGFHEELETEFNAMSSLGTLKTKDTESLSTYTEVMHNIKMFKKFFRTAFTSNEHVSALMEENQGQLDLARQQQKRSNEGSKQLIISSLVFYIVLSLVTVLWLARTITRRLDVLVGNAHRLPLGLPLEERVSGVDELAYLDTVLHEADSYLREAKEARGLLMEMVAHDMRSPLMSAQIALELLGQQLTADASAGVQRQTTALRRNLSVVINLVDDLLTIDRLEAGALELDRKPCYVQHFVEDAIVSVSALAIAKGITLTETCPEDLIVNADHDRVVQVVTNLITNAIKFSPKGSTITVSAEKVNPYGRICVQDQGPGLPPGMEAKIFEKFQQVEKEHAKRGYGLGLTICKMLTELHGGTIRAHNMPEGGSRFCFSLPLGANAAD
jgi:signal transduction histidine kinase